MMASLEDRVTKLEERMDLLSQKTTLANDTASDALHIAHLNAGLLNALRETQVEHGNILASHGRRLDTIEGHVIELKEDVSVLKGDVSELRSGQGAIVGLLEELIRRDDERRTDSEGVSD